jgi:putative sigma-54 modulation protein
MQVNVSFKNSDVIDNIRSRAEEKALKIKKFMKSPIRVEFVFSKDNLSHVSELSVSGDGAKFNSSVTSNDYLSAIDESVNKVVSQIKKHKEKTQEKRK